MGDVMLHGVLNMPPELWNESDSLFGKLDKNQRHCRYVEASERIVKQDDEIAELKAHIKKLEDYYENSTTKESLAIIKADAIDEMLCELEFTNKTISVSDVFEYTEQLRNED